MILCSKMHIWYMGISKQTRNPSGKMLILHTVMTVIYNNYVMTSSFIAVRSFLFTIMFVSSYAGLGRGSIQIYLHWSCFDIEMNRVKTSYTRTHVTLYLVISFILYKTKSWTWFCSFIFSVLRANIHMIQAYHLPSPPHEATRIDSW